jgi:hypothetical protein
MTDDERKEFERELAEVKERVAQLEGRPVATWTAAERAAGRENAMRVKRLMQLLIDDSRRAGSAG